MLFAWCVSIAAYFVYLPILNLMIARSSNKIIIYIIADEVVEQSLTPSMALRA
jgi:hypothetical protein